MQHKRAQSATVSQALDIGVTPMDQERVQMLETLGKIKDYYYGYNEGASHLAALEDKKKQESIAAGSLISMDDDLTTRDGESEDYVMMSYAEFNQLTDLAKRQSKEIEQLHEELSMIDKLKEKLEKPVQKSSQSIQSNNGWFNKQSQSRRTMSMREGTAAKKMRNPNLTNNS